MPRIQVCLISLGSAVRQSLTAVLDSTVATGDAEFDLENKVVEVLFMPEETGGRDGPTLGALTDDDAIFHSPKMLISFPALERCSIKEFFPAGLCKHLLRRDRVQCEEQY